MRKTIFMTIAAFILQFAIGQPFSVVRQSLEDQFNLERGQIIEWTVNVRIGDMPLTTYDKFNPEFEIVQL